jgi:serine protease Do
MNSNYSGTVTRGILSGKNRMVEVSVSSSSNDWIMNVMQTDAAISPGNSGGPLCNVSGEVIGINSMKIVEFEVEGIGFAIPIEDALEYADKIVKGIEIKRSYLGIKMGDISTSYYSLLRNNISIDSSVTSGVVVFEAYTGGPCERAGIQKGDVIIQINNDKVDTVAKLRYYLFKHSPNEEVSIKVIRGTTQKEFKVVLGESE